MSHTPGPWIVERDVQSTVIKEGLTRGMVAWACANPFPEKLSRGFSAEQILDNARLIAAAPDLLAACKLALEEGDLFKRDRAALEAAIAKAEGK